MQIQKGLQVQTSREMSGSEPWNIILSRFCSTWHPLILSRKQGALKSLLRADGGAPLGTNLGSILSYCYHCVASCKLLQLHCSSSLPAPIFWALSSPASPWLCPPNPVLAKRSAIAELFCMQTKVLKWSSFRLHFVLWYAEVEFPMFSGQLILC